MTLSISQVVQYFVPGMFDNFINCLIFCFSIPSSFFFPFQDETFEIKMLNSTRWIFMTFVAIFPFLHFSFSISLNHSLSPFIFLFFHLPSLSLSLSLSFNCLVSLVFPIFYTFFQTFTFILYLVCFLLLFDPVLIFLEYSFSFSFSISLSFSSFYLSSHTLSLSNVPLSILFYCLFSSY